MSAPKDPEPLSPKSDEEIQDWRTLHERAADKAQALRLMEEAKRGGLRFEVYLPPRLAEWLLGLVAQGVSTDGIRAISLLVAATTVPHLGPYSQSRGR